MAYKRIDANQNDAEIIYEELDLSYSLAQYIERSFILVINHWVD